MDSYNYTDSFDESKQLIPDSETPTEYVLRLNGIDPHAVIPKLAETMTYQEVAQQLSQDIGKSISQSWVSWFLNHHYSKVRRWVRKAGA